MSQTSTTTKSRRGIKLLREIASELRKVVWLTRREAVYLTLLVVLLSVAVGIILGAFDYGFSRLAQVVFTGG